MSKDYFCKDCLHNNNGWCKKRRIQGLKNITNCQEKLTAHYEKIKPQEDKNSRPEAYKQFGKREMFHNIQRQMLAIDEDNGVDKYHSLKQIMVNLEKMLQVEERIHGIATDYLIDQDIIDSSKAISGHWLKEVGEFK
jgi:hypothetical protein